MHIGFGKSKLLTAIIIVALLAGELLLLLQAGRAVAAGESFDSTQELGTWSDSPSPVNDYTLRSVSIVGPNAAWAVGYKVAPNGIPNGGVILFWNGSNWSVQNSTAASLWGVSMLSANDGWAVGQTGSTLTGDAAILHWNGSTWSAASIPSGCERLTGISMASAGQGWAVGVDCILEFTGTWSKRTSLAATSFLDAVTAISPTNVWAVGETEYGYLFAHYDGSMWTMTEKFSLGDRFASISAVSASDIWAAGSISGKIVRWNGSDWSLDVPVDGALYGIEMKSSVDGWVVGNVISHWDGISWTRVAGTYSDRTYYGIDMKDYYGWTVGSNGRIRRYLEEVDYNDLFLPFVRN